MEGGIKLTGGHIRSLRFHGWRVFESSQYQADIERSAPAKLFAQPLVKALFERLLYVYHSRHPATGYVQGMNDLMMPFFAVFLGR